MTNNYFTHANPKPRKANIAGNREETTYIEKTDDNGHKYLVESGKKNIYDIIQSHKDETNMGLLIQRYTNGDAEIARRIASAGIQGDTTQIPKNMTDAMNILRTQEQNFEKLPTSIKQKFGNNWREYAATAGTTEWLKKMNAIKYRKKEETKKEETKE